MEKNKIYKIIVKSVIVFCLLCVCLSNSEKTVYAGNNSLFEGSGTIDDPFLIYDCEDLLAFSESVNSGVTYYHQYVQLANDIDMQGFEMQPIGIFGDGNYFWGTFDGNGYVIKNINVQSDSNTGLFGQLGGTVMNLGIESGSISGGYCNGSIASHSASQSAMIINCYNRASVFGIYRAGGIADNFDGTILNCWSDSMLDAKQTACIVSYSCRVINCCYSIEELRPNHASCGLDSKKVYEEFLYSGNMASLLNENLSNNLYYDIGSKIDVSRLNTWQFVDGGLGFTHQKAEVYKSLKIRPVLSEIFFFCLLIFFLLVFVYYFRIKNDFVKLNNQKTALLSTAFIISSFLAFLITILVFRGSLINSIFFKDSSDTYMDFYNSVYDAANKRPYENRVIYPPICNLIYYICSRFVSPKRFQGVYHFPGGNEIRNDQGINIAFFLYNGFIFLILFISLSAFFRNKCRKVRALIVISTLCSLPFLYAFERGNIILMSFAFLMFYLATYNSKNKYIREMGLISLAIGGVIKIYPVIYGVLLLQDKRFKEAIRTIIYGIIVFFAPFLFFGGTNAIILLINNITRHTGKTGGISLYKFNVNPTGIYSYFSEFTNLDFSSTKWFGFFIGFVLLLISFFEFEKWKKVAMITCSIICIMPTVGVYVMIYMLLPWFIMLKDKDKEWNKIDYYYNCLFISLFAIVPLGVLSRLKYYNPTYIVPVSQLLNTITITLFSFSLIIEFVYLRFSKKMYIVVSSLMGLFVLFHSVYSYKMASGIPFNNGIYIDLTINDSSDSSKYVLSGLDQCIDGYTWTDSNNIIFSYLQVEPGNDYQLIFNIHDTYNSEYFLQEIVLYNDNEEIYRCVTKGESTVIIPFHSNKDKMILRVELPMATSPYTLEHVEDRRSLSLQLESIEILPV